MGDSTKQQGNKSGGSFFCNILLDKRKTQLTGKTQVYILGNLCVFNVNGILYIQNSQYILYYSTADIKGRLLGGESFHLQTN